MCCMTNLLDIISCHVIFIKNFIFNQRRNKGQMEKRRYTEAVEDQLNIKQVPRTLESTREPDATFVDFTDDETKLELKNDEYLEYFDRCYEPQVLLTTSDNPHTKTLRFVKELTKIFPNSHYLRRERSSIKKIIQSAKKRNYTDIVIINEDKRKPDGLLVSHLPKGPTAFFKLSSVKLTNDIKHGIIQEFTGHRPEVILNNFHTRLGQLVSRVLAALFHYDPQFKGRRAVTFHNQRDYIFFRHHRYEFKSSSKAALRELGPRFTLRLQWLQDGTFDTIHGDYEWNINGKRHEIETSRRKFFL
nr:EOG090X09U6 [Macrothrix elegans]